MRSLPWIAVGWFLGLVPAAAQEPQLWRDPDHGCTYILTRSGGVGLRYRADGTPDCPDAHGAVAGPSSPPASRASTAGVARPAATGTRAAVPAPRAAQRILPPDPVTTGAIARATGELRDDRGPDAGSPARAAAPDMPRRLVLAFQCRPTEGGPRDGVPATARVQVEPEARSMLVEAGGAPQRYTLDTDWDTWFNGRSERDPRLGLILSPSRGSMWLDVAARASPRQDVRSLAFACEPD